MTEAKFQKKNILITATTKLLLLFLVAGFVLPLSQSSIVKAQEDGGIFTIKLTNTTDYSELLEVGQNINHLFLGSQNEQFKNIYTFSSSQNLSDLKNILNSHFVYLESQKIIQAADVFVNDPGYTVDSKNIDKQWGLAKAAFTQAWQKTTGSKSNIVALVDTGVDATHEDLKGITYVPGADFINRQDIAPGINSDDNGHGTLVAGVLGASVNNNKGIAGTNWEMSLMPIKALDSTGKGDASTLSQAIVWATDHGAQFINLSVGGIGFGHDTTLANAISYAFNKGVLIVAAAGNDINTMGSSLDQSPVFPICDDNNYNMVIGVAATDQNDLKADFSNYGKNCIDVDAPGKRILSTISFDPLTKKSVPNSYAYASGTSLGVPFVVGQAMLIKALYPTATNIQIRDIILSTSDNIDALNLSQCGGGSCAGQLGVGRINVAKSLESQIVQNFSEGDLVKVTDAGVTYQILGGQKRLVSAFVLNQRFPTAPLKTATFSQLASYPEGPYVTPLDGTLVKFDSNPTVYIIQNGAKLPVTYEVFLQHKLSFKNVNTLSFSELNSWTTGSFYPPEEGSLVRAKKNPTVYWVVGQVLHPINNRFSLDRGLNIFPVLVVPDGDIAGYAKGEAYIR